MCLYIQGGSNLATNELFWTQVSAISQALAALGTFAAVIVSLWLALRANRPTVKLTVGERLIIGPLREFDENLLMFSVANAGSRPVKITGLGWETGWLRWGPKFLRKQYAVQTFGGTALGQQPPFELPVGVDASCYSVMENFLKWASEKKGPPFFSRDIPVIGRVRTRVKAYASTADGHIFKVAPEKAFVTKAVDIEKRANQLAAQGNRDQPTSETDTAQLT